MKAHVFQLESGRWIFPILALLLKAVWSVLPDIPSFGMSLGRTPQRPACAEKITVCVRPDVPESLAKLLDSIAASASILFSQIACRTLN